MLKRGAGRSWPSSPGAADGLAIGRAATGTARLGRGEAATGKVGSVGRTANSFFEAGGDDSSPRDEMLSKGSEIAAEDPTWTRSRNLPRSARTMAADW